MPLSIRKTLSLVAMSAVLSVSLIGICTQMLTPCVLNCSDMTASAMSVNAHADGCGAQKSASCPAAPAHDHLTTFATLYPSVGTDSAPLPLLAASAVFLLAWFLIARKTFDVQEKLRVKLRSFRKRLSNFVEPNFLVFAFSHGILNSKIYASS